MKRGLFFLLFSVLVSLAPAQEHRRYALVWQDEFDKGALDENVWSKIPRRKSAWAVHMSKDEKLFAFEGGDLVLRGVVNEDRAKDTATYLTGGVWSKGKKAFGFGRVEVRAKFDVAQGYWPAIWMQPEADNSLKWPHGGEIDIMEHFGYSTYVNHTVHTHYTHNLGKRWRPPHVANPSYNPGQYNTYAVERFQDSLVFFVNGKRTFCYPRYRGGRDEQFPFDQNEFFLILDSQIGLDGSPYVDVAQLPVELRIDYVRYYELDTKTDVIPEPQVYEQTGARRFRFRKMTVNTSETFSHPDEYHIVVKRGRAKVSGNVKWAESTLAQLVGSDGRICNLELRDKPANARRGVSLDKYVKKLDFEAIKNILETMASHKLNCLQWNGKGACSEDEIRVLKEQARSLGVSMLTTVTDQGEWFYLEGMEPDDLKALMVFADRCWRGIDPTESQLENIRSRITVRYNSRSGSR
jgi:beta-glucanase (GH16 family)